MTRRMPWRAAPMHGTTRMAELARAFVRLDARLERVLAAFDAAQGGPTTDRLRGLYITSDDAHHLLERTAFCSVWNVASGLQLEPLWIADPGSAADTVRLRFGLSQVDLDALLVALAPECDLRYERIYAYLQDDVTRKRPSVDLMLNLLCGSQTDRLEMRGVFASEGPLIRQGLVALVSDPHQHHPPMLAQYVVPDEHIIRSLLFSGGLDSRLTGCCRVDRPSLELASLELARGMGQQLRRLARSIAGGLKPVVWLTGPHGAGKSSAVAAAAHEARAALLTLDARSVPAAESESILRVATREAEAQEAILFVSHADAWIDDRLAIARLKDMLTRPRTPVVVAATAPIPPALLGCALPIELPVPPVDVRIRCWRRALGARADAVGAAPLRFLGRRFRLTPGQIVAAVSDATRRSPRPTRDDFAAAARAQSNRALESLADRLQPHARWEDIVLPDDTRAQLRELCDRVEVRDRVLGDWGFARASARGQGVSALFAGPSGTGKTMAAEVVATALGLDLYRIDLARVVSKYVGETERNLSRVFTAATDSNAILFFDEADALFGKRSEVKDAHDRYANIEIAYLLQKMEEYDGVAILATNLPDHLDEAFTRRLAFTIPFGVPDEAARLEIWNRVWPREVPLAPSVQRPVLARELRVSGGTIRNIAVGAAFYAAGDGGMVTVEHVRHAARREFDKQGRAGRVPLLESSAAGTSPVPMRQAGRG